MAEEKTATPPKPPAKKAAPRKRAPAKKTAAKKPAAKKTTATPPVPPLEKGTDAPEKKPGKASAAEPAPQPGYIRRQVTDTAKKVARPEPGKSYHRVVLGEFVVCVVLVFTGSIVTPKIKDGAYVFVHILVQLTALCAVFFILALLGSGKKTGKVAAAFGALVTLGVMLNSTPAIKEIGMIFAPSKKPAPLPSETTISPNKPVVP